MRDKNKTKEQLILEMAELRRRITDLESSELVLKQTEVQLRESQEKYADLVELAPDGIITMDIKGFVTSINRAFTGLTGFENDEIVGRHFTKIGTVRSRDIIRYIPLLANIFKGKHAEPFEFPYYRKNGTSGTGEAHIAMLKERGKVVGLQGILRDITKHKQIEVALRDSESKYRTLIENAGEAILVAQDGFLKFVNPRATEITGYSEDELKTKPFLEFVHPDDREMVFERYSSRLRGQDIPKSYQLRIVNKDGDIIWVEINVVVIRWEARSATLTFLADITDRKKAEEELHQTNRHLAEILEELESTQQQVIQQERLRALGELASGIAHDFNNALVPMMGYSELLINVPTILNDKIKTMSYLEMINTAAEDAKNIVSRLKEFYRQREENEEFVSIALNKLVEESVKLTQPKWKDQAQANGVNIEVDTDLREIPPIYGSKSDLREVLTNLIFNAVDAIPSSGVVTIRTRNANEHVVLELNDTGLGMTEEVRQRCFDPFFSTKGKSGTGLGLSMVHGIVRRHEGTIQIDSEVGQGTTIAISLPLANAVREEDDGEQKTDSLRSLHVLVVDDEPAARNIVSEYLKVNGHTYEVAQDGESGLEKFQKGKFDLVITDRAMPGMGGIQLASFIKEIESDIPIIMFTGFGDIMQSTGESPNEVDYIISKPVTLDKFQETLAKLGADYKGYAAK